MHILQLTHRLPYPPIDGGKIGIFNFTKYFSLFGNDVNLISLAPLEEKGLNIEELRGYTSFLKVFYKDTKNKKISLLKNTFFSKLPYNMEKYIHKDVMNFILSYICKNKIDIIHVDHLHMAFYAKEIRKRYPNIPIAIREHNVEYVILERFYKSLKEPISRLLIKKQYTRLKKYETKILTEFNKILAITEVDKNRLIKENSSLTNKIEVIPVGVDINKFKFYDNPFDRRKNLIVSISSMDWIPNQQGLIWFIEKVMPYIVNSIPNAKLYIIGKGMPNWFKKYEDRKNVFILGFIDDEGLEKILQVAKVAITPLFVGGGMRVKILNYLAWGLPTVSTSIGVEGIEVTNGTEILIADDESLFAKGVISLLKEENLWNKLRKKGRKKIEDTYSWNKIVKRTLSIYESLLK